MLYQMRKKILYIVATVLYGYAVKESLPYDEIEKWKGNSSCFSDKLEDKINTPEHSDIGYSVEVHLNYPDEIKVKKAILFMKIKLFLKNN